MNTRSSGHTAIELCLQEEVSIMSSLAELLKKEQTALIESDVIQLNDFTQSKGQLVVQMTELEKKRNAYLQELGYKTDIDGMQAYLQATAMQNSAQHWDTLLQLTAQAKEDNRANGLLINRRLSLNQATLNLLQQNTNQAGSMYGPNGQSTVKSTPGKGYIAT
ncbi:flagella synthesis protein FlgN [Undibacterium sp. JH2W]|uniref:flagella synthesis protein FlgN n=1 Tax=Undibacterium sp. JH2W TaxID=3413037 RepID=UPI003BF067EC